MNNEGAPVSQELEPSKDLNRSQFGANAANYATSTVHAKGASLGRLVELFDFQPDWHCLDVATAAGHTAFAVAPHVGSVIATDLTPEMVTLASERATELGHGNVTTQVADAEALPFEDNTFDLVTCRIAPHHFPSPEMFIAEVARVTKPGGRFCLIDNIVPDNSAVAATYNAWEKLRDPSHAEALSLERWTDLCIGAGLEIAHSELMGKQMNFLAWLDNMSVAEDLRPKLLDQLVNAEPDVAQFLRPTGDTIETAGFVLTEGVLVASKP